MHFVSWLYKTSTLQGAPDLSARYPHIFVLLAEASVCFLLIQHARTLCDPCNLVYVGPAHSIIIKLALLSSPKEQETP